MNTYTEGKPYIFISYSSGDKDIVVKGVERLHEQYGLNIWYDENITGGTNWEKNVRQIIRDDNCRAVLFFAGKNALLSSYVKFELDIAHNWGKFIIPINFEDRLFSDILKEINTGYNKTAPEFVNTAEYIIGNFLEVDSVHYIVLDVDSDKFYNDIISALKDKAPELLPESARIPETQEAAAVPAQERRYKYSYLDTDTKKYIEEHEEVQERAHVLLDKADEIGSALDEAGCMVMHNGQPIKWAVCIEPQEDGNGYWQKIVFKNYGHGGENLYINIKSREMGENVTFTKAKVASKPVISGIQVADVADSDLSDEMKKVVACLYEKGYLKKEAK